MSAFTTFLASTSETDRQACLGLLDTLPEHVLSEVFPGYRFRIGTVPKVVLSEILALNPLQVARFTKLLSKGRIIKLLNSGKLQKLVPEFAAAIATPTDFITSAHVDEPNNVCAPEPSAPEPSDASAPEPSEPKSVFSYLKALVTPSPSPSPSQALVVVEPQAPQPSGPISMRIAKGELPSQIIQRTDFTDLDFMEAFKVYPELFQKDADSVARVLVSLKRFKLLESVMATDFRQAVDVNDIICTSFELTGSKQLFFELLRSLRADPDLLQGVLFGEATSGDRADIINLLLDEAFPGKTDLESSFMMMFEMGCPRCAEAYFEKYEPKEMWLIDAIHAGECEIAAHFFRLMCANDSTLVTRVSDVVRDSPHFNTFMQSVLCV